MVYHCIIKLIQKYNVMQFAYFNCEGKERFYGVGFRIGQTHICTAG